MVPRVPGPQSPEDPSGPDRLKERPVHSVRAPAHNGPTLTSGRTEYGDRLLAYIGLVAAAWSACTAVVGNVCGAGLGVLLIFPIFVVLWGIFDIVIYVEAGAIERLVDAGEYEQAKSKTLVWTIIGFILGGIIVGIVMLVAYFKMDPLITWQRNRSATTPYGAPTPAPGYSSPAPPPPPVGASTIRAERFCPACGAGNLRASAFCHSCGNPLPPST